MSHRSDVEEDPSSCTRGVLRYSPPPLDLMKHKPADIVADNDTKSKNTASFCIEALLGRRETTAASRKTVSLTASSEDCSSTPCSSRSGSVSPGPEALAAAYDDGDTVSAAAAAIGSVSAYAADVSVDFPSSRDPHNHNHNHHHHHHHHRRNSGFGFVHGSSAFQPLSSRGGMDPNANGGNPPGQSVQSAVAATAANAAAAAAAAANRANVSAGQLQQMQLEWFARAGMFYAGPRLHDLTGTPSTSR